jgi:prepilin-type N-terminal cleavage/methylation domain-containing protein
MSPTRTASGRATGFTLIEMMIAIALGLAVIYVAFAGFRVAAQSVTLVNRLGTENDILRAGLTIAMDDTDFWSSHDDPFDAGNAQGRQPLRAPPAAVGMTQRGLPFTSFAAAAAANAYRHVADTYQPSTPWQAAEAAEGWNPNAWTANESRGWAWGNLAERVPIGGKPDKLQTFGRYHWFSSTDSSSAHRWQQRQLDGLKNALGYYGLLDYVPANTGLMIYERNPASGKWGVSSEWCFVNGGAPYYLGNDNRLNGLNFAQDILSVTNGNPFIVPSPRATGLVNIAFQRYSTGISLSTSDNNASIGNIDRLLADGDVATDWLPARARPSHWPSLSVSSLRFIRTSSYVCLNRIRWTSPLTGQVTELDFTAFGTSLRGARQQRKRDAAGWADPFAASPSGDPNLDTY